MKQMRGGKRGTPKRSATPRKRSSAATRSPASRPDGGQGGRDEEGGFGSGNAEQPQAGFGELVHGCSHPFVPGAARATAAAQAAPRHGAERDFGVGGGEAASSCPARMSRRARGASPRDASRVQAARVMNRAMSGCVQPSRPEIRNETANTSAGSLMSSQAGRSPGPSVPSARRTRSRTAVPCCRSGCRRTRSRCDLFSDLGDARTLATALGDQPHRARSGPAGSGPSAGPAGWLPVHRLRLLPSPSLSSHLPWTTVSPWADGLPADAGWRRRPSHPLL